jgi:hypothetical protein
MFTSIHGELKRDFKHRGEAPGTRLYEQVKRLAVSPHR